MPRRATDPEADGGALAHTVSSPLEQQRPADFEADNFGGTKKAGTFPAGPPNNMPPRTFEASEPLTTSPEKEEDRLDSNSSGSARLHSEAPNDGITDRSAGTEAGPRKRKMRKFIPFMGKKHGEEDEAELQRTETTESKKKKQWPKPSFGAQLKAVFASWINIMLVFVPVGIALAQIDGINGIVVFIINFLAIIPLAAMLSFATEELAIYVGETLGGLLNASFGNAVELIVSIIALAQGKIVIVQTSLVGSMLSNLLLVLGMCFFFGGLKRQEQFFNVTVAQTASSLLALAIGSLIIPTAFRIFEDRATGVAPLSRGTSVLLLITYGAYLYFQLSTHATMYNEPSQKVPKRQSGRKESGDVLRGIATMGAGTAAVAGGEINQQHLVHEEEEEEETPQLSRLGALVTLAGSTVLVAFCAEYMVSSIDDLTSGGKVSEEFVGLILLPIVGNAAEHATAVTVAIKDKMDLAIGVAVGSSLQIALLVFPLMVIIGWIGLGQPEDMTLNLDGFQVAVLFISIILVNYLIQVSFDNIFLTTAIVTNMQRRMVRVIGSKASCSTSPTLSSLLRLGTIPTPRKANLREQHRRSCSLSTLQTAATSFPSLFRAPASRPIPALDST
jgi:Ca2+:H+ antiporter